MQAILKEPSTASTAYKHDAASLPSRAFRSMESASAERGGEVSK